MQIRTKEARCELYVDGVKQGGSFVTIHDITVKPDAAIHKKRFTGEKRARGDLDVVGHDVTFKSEESDHIWSDLWTKIQEKEANGLELPDIVIVLTYSYRGSAGQVRSVTLHGDPAMKMDENSIPQDGYVSNQWSAFFSYATPA